MEMALGPGTWFVEITYFLLRRFLLDLSLKMLYETFEYSVFFWFHGIHFSLKNNNSMGWACE